MKAVLVIPALNEEDSIGRVLSEVPAGLFNDVFVVDNGSTDGTAQRASARGATVLHEPLRGYGNACLRALRELPSDTDVVVFMDGDGSDVPAEASRLLGPIADRQADLVLGSRELGPFRARCAGPASAIRQSARDLVDPTYLQAPLYRPRSPSAPFVDQASEGSGCAIPTTAGRSKCRSGLCSKVSASRRSPSPTGAAAPGPVKCQAAFGAASRPL